MLREEEVIECVLWHDRALFLTVWKIGYAPPRLITLVVPGLPDYQSRVNWVLTDEFGLFLGRRRFHYQVTVDSPGASFLGTVSAVEMMAETNRRDAARRSRPRIPLQLRRDNEL